MGFYVTDEWLKAYATKDGHGWTAAQLSALGVDWPPPKGWRKEIIGSYIGDDQRRDFEGRGKFVVTWGWMYRYLPKGQQWWTRDQLGAIGVRWPPAKGAIKAVVGRPISDHARRQFEAGGQSTSVAQHA